MTDLFDKGDAASLLRNKTIILLGGSVIRGLYKDLIWLLNSNSLIDSGVIRPDSDRMRNKLTDYFRY